MISGKIKDTDVHVGDTIRVKSNVIEGERVRVQSFEGVLISLRGRGENATFGVRRVGNRNIGVERIWPVNASSLVGIEVVRKTKKVRRSKLFFLRNLTGKMSSAV